jgi:putative flippase GtrA
VKHLSGQAARFLVVGAISTAIQYVVLVIAVELFDMRADVGSALGYLISAAVSYVANRRYTFRSDAPHKQAAFRFVVVLLVGLAMNTLCMTLLAEHWGVPYIAAQVIATGIVTVWNFLGHALWSFRARTPSP